MAVAKRDAGGQAAPSNGTTTERTSGAWRAISRPIVPRPATTSG